MKTRDVVLKNTCEVSEWLRISRIKAIAALFSILLICSVLTMPEVALLEYEEGTVERAYGVKLHKGRMEISLVPTENDLATANELKPETVITTEEMAVALVPEVIAPVEKTDAVGLEATIIDKVVADEETKDVVVTTPIVSEEAEEVVSTLPELTWTGSLRMDYCVGSDVDLSQLHIFFGETEVSLAECEVTGMDTSSAGERNLVVTHQGMSLEIPYKVVDYKVVLRGAGNETTCLLYDYLLDAENMETPVRLGKVFTGWYRDEACTVPFVSAQAGETVVELYAGWKDFDHYLCDDYGYIQAYTGEAGSVRDELLNLPAHSSCVGVRAGAFADMEDFVTDIYIPANITNIESGAFDTLPYVFWIYVHPDNPAYCSVDGILYTKDKSRVVAYPSARAGW